MALNLSTAAIAELDAVRNECYSMVTRRAVISGAAVLVPIPGSDIAADIGMLMKLIPAINGKFGLSEDHISELNPELKIFVLDMIKKIGTNLVGRSITKDLILHALKKAGMRITTKSAIKFVPIIGQGIAIAISVAAMRYVGRSHVDECYKLAKKIISDRPVVS